MKKSIRKNKAGVSGGCLKVKKKMNMGNDHLSTAKQSIK